LALIRGKKLQSARGREKWKVPELQTSNKIASRATEKKKSSVILPR